MRRGFIVVLSLLCLHQLFTVPGIEAQLEPAPLAADQPTTARTAVDDSTTGRTAEGETDGDRPEGVIEESVTVTETRLRDAPHRADRQPAHVTVIDAERIERAGVQTLQDLLSLEAGVVLYDQTGNDVAKTFDLRGFAGGTATKVFLDGAPLNSSRNNGLALELVPLAALERIEIRRGSATALAGGGAQGGVINLWTRRGQPFGGSLSASAGDFGTEEIRGQIHQQAGRFDLSLSGSWYETDGFRQNAGGDLSRFAATFGYDLGGDRRLTLSVVDGSSDFGTPGALTVGELEDDPGQAPFNQLDFADEGLTQTSLTFAGPVGGSFSLAANLFYRDRGSEILSTGRAAPLFGGFFLDSVETVVGSTVQLGHRLERGAIVNDLHFGFEWLDGETDAAGFFTPAGDPGLVDPASPASLNTAERTTTAVFAQENLSLSAAWTLQAGLRYDADNVGYRETQPDPALDDSREFSELSLRTGVTWTPTEVDVVWLSYGEAFLPPTVEQLFSFPLFGSNPDLEPEDSASWEVGYRRRLAGAVDLNLALFQIDTQDEIIFDPNSPLGLFGANVNGGETRRQGVEVSLRGPVADGLELFTNLTLVDAQFQRGPNRGNSVPLVPNERLSLGFLVQLPAALSLRAEGLYVGDQVLDNDPANAQGTLDAYTVVSARLSWAVSAWRRGAAGGDGIELYVDARNLLDERYATRGIFAFDFSTFANEVFLTPAPGRRILGGVAWKF